MKKLTLFFFALLAVCLAFQACDNSKTYAEMLEEEKDAIKAFIKDSSIVVISQSEFYAQDSTTDVSRNEYVQLASGVYMQIVDKGSTNHTYLNGEMMDAERSYELSDQDSIRIADEEFTY